MLFPRLPARNIMAMESNISLMNSGHHHRNLLYNRFASLIGPRIPPPGLCWNVSFLWSPQIEAAAICTYIVRLRTDVQSKNKWAYFHSGPRTLVHSHPHGSSDSGISWHQPFFFLVVPELLPSPCVPLSNMQWHIRPFIVDGKAAAEPPTKTKKKKISITTHSLTQPSQTLNCGCLFG